MDNLVDTHFFVCNKKMSDLTQFLKKISTRCLAGHLLENIFLKWTELDYFVLQTNEVSIDEKLKNMNYKLIHDNWQF